MSFQFHSWMTGLDDILERIDNPVRMLWIKNLRAFVGWLQMPWLRRMYAITKYSVLAVRRVARPLPA